MRSIYIAILALFCLATFSSACSCGESIDWMSDYTSGLERARIERKPVMIDFYTSWCYYCKVLDVRTYTDKEIIELSDQLVSLKINAERERQLARDYFIRAYPIIVFLSREGREIKRVYGYQSPSALERVIRKILSDSTRVEALGAAYEKDPKNTESAYLYADELMAKGRFAEAEGFLKKVVRDKRSPRKEDATLDLGICKFRQGDFKQAAGQVSKFLTSFKGSDRTEEARLFYGLSLVASGQEEEGIGELKSLHRKASRKWIAEEALRQLNLGGGGTG
ncbi:MAG: hypothetical protein AMJ46_09575 [Latescibacteria bacterium DG_63]|nr:MAG: hypothetical protein AMJ46_09575 [Latescibacteria bacterium DG_63]